MSEEQVKHATHFWIIVDSNNNYVICISWKATGKDSGIVPEFLTAIRTLCCSGFCCQLRHTSNLFCVREKHIWKASLSARWRGVEASACLKEKGIRFIVEQWSRCVSKRAGISIQNQAQFLLTQVITWYTPHKCDGNIIIISFTVSEKPSAGARHWCFRSPSFFFIFCNIYFLSGLERSL